MGIAKPRERNKLLYSFNSHSELLEVRKKEENEAETININILAAKATNTEKRGREKARERYRNEPEPTKEEKGMTKKPKTTKMTTTTTDNKQPKEKQNKSEKDSTTKEHKTNNKKTKTNKKNEKKDKNVNTQQKRKVKNIDPRRPQKSTKDQLYNTTNKPKNKSHLQNSKNRSRKNNPKKTRVQRPNSTQVPITDLIIGNTHYTDNQKQKNYEPPSHEKQYKAREDERMLSACTRSAINPQQLIMTIGGGQTGLRTTCHGKENGSVRDGVTKQNEARDTPANEEATLERAQIVYTNSRLQHKWGTRYERYTHASGESICQLGNTFPTQSVVETIIKLKNMRHLEEPRMWAEKLIQSEFDSRPQDNLATKASIKKGKQTKPDDGNFRREDANDYSWKIVEFGKFQANKKDTKRQTHRIKSVEGSDSLEIGQIELIAPKIKNVRQDPTSKVPDSHAQHHDTSRMNSNYNFKKSKNATKQTTGKVKSSAFKIKRTIEEIKRHRKPISINTHRDTENVAQAPPKNQKLAISKLGKESNRIRNDPLNSLQAWNKLPQKKAPSHNKNKKIKQSREKPQAIKGHRTNQRTNQDIEAVTNAHLLKRDNPEAHNKPKQAESTTDVVADEAQGSANGPIQAATSSQDATFTGIVGSPTNAANSGPVEKVNVPFKPETILKNRNKIRKGKK